MVATQFVFSPQNAVYFILSFLIYKIFKFYTGCVRI